MITEPTFTGYADPAAALAAEVLIQAIRDAQSVPVQSPREKDAMFRERMREREQARAFLQAGPGVAYLAAVAGVEAEAVRERWEGARVPK